MMNGSEASAREMECMRSAWRALVGDWALTWGERRALLPAGGEDTPSPPVDTETRMRILIEIARRVPVYDGELVDWLREPAEALGWSSPLEAMSSPLPGLRRFRRFAEQGFDA